MLVVVGAVRRRGAGDGGGGVLLWVCWCAKGVLVAGCCAGREGVSGRAGRGDAAHLGQEGGDGGRRMVQRNKSGRAAMMYVSILFFCFRFFELNVCWPSLFFEKTEVRTVISGDVLFHITVLKKHRYRSTFTRLPSHTESELWRNFRFSHYSINE